MGAPGWLSRLSASNFGSGHDLTVCEFKPRVRLCADSLEPGACFGFCVSLSFCPSPAYSLSLSVSKINKNIKKKKNPMEGGTFLIPVSCKRKLRHKEVGKSLGQKC